MRAGSATRPRRKAAGGEQECRDRAPARLRHSPKTCDTEPVLIRFHRNTLNAIDQMVADDPETPSRPEILRRIVIEWFMERGIEAEE